MKKPIFTKTTSDRDEIDSLSISATDSGKSKILEKETPRTKEKDGTVEISKTKIDESIDAYKDLKPYRKKNRSKIVND